MDKVFENNQENLVIIPNHLEMNNFPKKNFSKKKKKSSNLQL
jgi:hypothetical protein